MLTKACALICPVLLISAAFFAADPAWYTKRGTWHETLIASREALAKANERAVKSVPLPDFGRDDLTIMAWVRTKSGGTIVSRSPAKGNWARLGKTLFIRGGQLAYDIGWVGGITSARRVADGKWHHVAMTKKGNSLRLYIDGQADRAAQLDGGTDAAGHVVKIGYTCPNFPAPSAFTGYLDDVRVYSRQLSPEEVKAHVAELQPAVANGLVGYWPFDAGGTDTSGSGNHATATGKLTSVTGRHDKAIKLSGGAYAVVPSSGEGNPADMVWAMLRRDFPPQAAKIGWEHEDRIWHQDWKAGDWSDLAKRYAQATRSEGGLAEQAMKLAKGVTDETGMAKIRDLYHRSRLRAQIDIKHKKPPAGQEAITFRDEAIAKAIAKGLSYLWSVQGPENFWQGQHKGYPVGETALVAYAMLECGVEPADPRFKPVLVWLAKTKTNKTYGLGIRANVWEAANRKMRGVFNKQIKDDVLAITRSSRTGGYSYGCSGSPGGGDGDNSNSQYALLGAWAGAKARFEIPSKYWEMVYKHWVRDQQPDGGWTYGRANKNGGKGTPTMTAAGLASLYVCLDNLHSARFLQCRGGADILAIKRGMAQFETNFAGSLKNLGGHPYYYLYGVERVGLASGYKYFGELDWYKTGATILLNRQGEDGGWGRPYQTAFALLFLARGQRPVLFNKLHFDGDWNNRPRDMAHLTRWLGRTFESTFNWQIINLHAPVEEWHDGPILYISGSKKPAFTAEQVAKLRRYVFEGGTILSVTECRGTGYQRGIREIFKKMFPQYQMQKLPADHPLYTVHFKEGIAPRKTKVADAVYTISNGIRPLVIHTDQDLSRDWQSRRTRTAKRSYELAANIVIYVTDKTFRHRGVRIWPEKKDSPSIRTIKVALIQHGGNCRPEPLAYERLARLMLTDTGTKLEMVGLVPPTALGQSAERLALMTGTRAFSMVDDHKAALKKFVLDGGTVIIDAAGGMLGGGKEFAASAEKLLAELFAPRPLKVLSSSYAIYTRKDLPIGAVKFRRLSRQRLGPDRAPRLRAVMFHLRPGVIFSREDITAGLVGYAAHGIDGYAPDSAYAIMRNAILHADDHAHRIKQPATMPTTKPKQGSVP